MGGGAPSKYEAPAVEADGTKFLLRERIKEMRCMYGLSNLIAAGKENAFHGGSVAATYRSTSVDPPSLAPSGDNERAPHYGERPVRRDCIPW